MSLLEATQLFPQIMPEATTNAAKFVSNLVIVYFVLIFIRILTSWVPRWPYNRALIGFRTFLEQTVDPYLNIFRAVFRPVGGGQFALDLSPMVATIVLLLGGAALVSAFNNF